MRDKMKTAIARIKAIAGVTDAIYCSDGDALKRIIIETKKLDGEKTHNGGVGYMICYIDVKKRQVVFDKVAGMKTQNWHAMMDTRGELQKIADTLQ